MEVVGSRIDRERVGVVRAEQRQGAQTVDPAPGAEPTT
jgi:hypothetical protein